ncbi:MAG: hypothetical protein GC168_10645 [Candidatus Hydrogenedens sp.]|nr:hypothetical protein [Candidatus Hydrogenedens sp.]
MPAIRTVVALFVLGSLLSACGGPAPQAPAPVPPATPLVFGVAGTYPLAGEPLEDRLVVYFTEPVAAGATLSLSPEAPVTETLVDGSHISLLLDTARLAPGTYTVQFAEGLQAASGAAFQAPDAPLTFTAEDNRPAVAMDLRLDSTGDESIKLSVLFTRPMDPGEMPDYITVADANGQSVAPEFGEAEDDSSIAFSVPARTVLPLTVTVNAGAPALNGSATQDTASFSYPLETLEVQEVTLEDDAPEGAIRLRWSLSQEVSLDEVGARLHAKDASGAEVAASVEPSDTASAFYVGLPASAELPVALTLDRGLPGTGGAQLVQDYTTTYPAGELKVTHVAWENPGGQDRLVLSFTDAVSWSDVQQRISVAEAETGRVVSLEGSGGRDTEVYLELLDVNGTENRLNVAINPGIRGSGLQAMTQPYETQVTREASPLDIDYADWRFRGKDGLALYLNLNQRVDMTALKDALRFEPAVENLGIEHRWGNSYEVSGGFASETDYILYVGTGATTPDGRGLLKKAIEYPLEQSPEGRPAAGFAFEDKVYFPRRTNGVLPLMARDTDNVHVSLSRLFPSNLPVAVNEIDSGKTWSAFEGAWARPIAEKDLPVRGAEGKAVTLPFDLHELLTDGARGVFGLTLDPEPNDYATKIVVWTDIGLMAHWLDDELVVFAHDLFTVAPIPNAKITLWSYKNQVMAEVQTDERGIARMSGLDTALGHPQVVVCETDNDYTFLKLDARGDDPVPTNDGMPSYDRDGYDAFLYADRNLYRPGETVHARWIVRTHYGDALAGVPLQLVVTNPQGAELSKEAVTLSDLGTGGIDYATDAAWPTGKYTFTLTVPESEQPAGSVTVSIEDFVPNRIKAEVQVPEGPWAANAEYTLTIAAEQLFGGPAVDQKAKASVILRKGDFKPAGWDGYRFTNDATYTAEVVPLGEAMTDDAGKAGFTYTYRRPAKVDFPLLATVRGEVAEAGARAVNDTKDALLLPDEPLLGVGLSQGASGGVEVAVAAVNAAGEAAPVSSVNVILERENWSYYVRRYADRNEPNFTKSYDIIERRAVPLVEGRGSCSFDLGEYTWGYHRVRVESSETPMTASSAFYKNWRGIDVAESPRPSLIKLTLDQASYHPGGTATLRIESPFDGQAVVVLQGDTFQQVLTAEVTDSAAEVPIAIEPGMYPNVWAAVTVVHRAPEDRNQVYPYSSFAMVNVPVPDPARQLDVALGGIPEELRPETPMTVTIETRGSDGAPRGAEVTVAAVDEGIHNILDYATPDPWNYFQRFRSPDHRRAHYYDKVAYDFDAAAIGGDLASRLAKRGATIGENWIKPVALWAGTVQTDDTGRAEVTFNVPEFTGQLRVVAVAADNNATGAADQNVFVRRPYMLQTSMPRFVLPGDRFEARATVFNTTGAAAEATVGWSATGTLVSPPGTAALTVPASGNTGTLAAFEAGSNVGQGQIDWSLEVAGAPDDRVTQTAPIPVRPPAAYQVIREQAIVQPGETRVFKNEVVSDDDNVTLAVTIGADPALRVYNALKYLIGYPYGCVEQTTSSCFPLYLLRKSSALMDETLPDQRRIEVYLNRGIDRLLSMQTTSGGLGYWPGARTPDRYGSVYALHFLTLIANDRELELPEAPYDRLRNYVRRLSQETSDQSTSGLYLRAYACFVLALGGDQEAMGQIGRFDNIVLPESARYLLAAAIAMQTGDQARAMEYLATKPMQPYTTYERAGTLNSAGRATAVKLMALMQMNAPEERVQPLVTELTAVLSQPHYANTQEIAFASAAMGTYLSRLAEGAGAQGTVSGPEGERAFGGREIFTLEHEGPGGAYTVSNTGDAPVYVSVETGGMPLQPNTGAVSEGGLALQRSIATLDGTAVADGRVKQGESYLVTLELTGPVGLENVVIADLLPAGFEIENPRLDAEVLALAGADNMAQPNYLDIRDDRLIIAFDRLPGHTTRYGYVVRAVTPGSYTHPASSAECMYDAAYRATTAAGRIEVAAE